MKQPNRNTKLLPVLGHPWKCRRYQQMKLSSHNSLRGMDLSELGVPLNLSNSPPGKSIKEHRKWICSRHQILLIRIFWNGLENCGEPTRLGGGAKNEHWTQKKTVFQMEQMNTNLTENNLSNEWSLKDQYTQITTKLIPDVIQPIKEDPSLCPGTWTCRVANLFRRHIWRETSKSGWPTQVVTS